MAVESDEAAISGNMRNSCISFSLRILYILMLGGAISAVYWNSQEIKIASLEIDVRSAMELAEKLSAKSHSPSSKQIQKNFDILFKEANKLQADLKSGPWRLQIQTQTVSVSMKKMNSEAADGSIAIKNLILTLYNVSYGLSEGGSYLIAAHYGSAALSADAYGSSVGAAVAFEVKYG